MLHPEKGHYTASLIDIEEVKCMESFRLVETTRQGLMAPGSFNPAGIFEEIVESVLHSQGIPPKNSNLADDIDLEAIELRLVAVYGSEDAPVCRLRRKS
ncbi:hypothetical protein [Salinicola halophyticus]|uniref:hypothetical protein n=1 Tax=Salinicola halophyticus TaxID=1808881 RepID=UPI00130067AA|nr:hypothetical protein [Salinicola halophyticus]